VIRGTGRARLEDGTMAMQVETFEATELVEGLEAEDVEQCERLAEKLGLKGQERFSGEPEGLHQRVPYREMTKEERFVYSTLLPSRASVEEYASGPIPLRVLQVLEHAKSLSVYTRFEVWHDMSSPDPVLVGWINWSASHILARWGSSLEPFQELRKKAVARFTARTRAKLTAIAQQVRADLDILSGVSDELADRLQDPHYTSPLVA